MPLQACRHDAGWLLGRTFADFVHTGRKTGRRYETLAMVLRYDADAREAVICAGWGPDTDWVRNPERVQRGRDVQIGVSVHPASDDRSVFYDGHSRPFHG